MIETFRKSIPAIGLSLTLLAAAVPASAEITAAGLIVPRPQGRNAVAFDSVNKVYLMVVSGHPVSGQFLDQNGNLIGGPFQLTFSEDGQYTGAATVTFGGPANDPAFLITFRSVWGSGHYRYGRLVRFRSGQTPLVGAAAVIADLAGDWFAVEKGQAVWNGSAFIVGTKIGVPGTGLAQPYLHFFHMNNTVTGGVSLGDMTDYQGSPSLACSSSVCLAAGYAAAYPFGTGGVIYSRRFDPASLQPVGGLFHLDDHSSRMDDPAVVFNTRTGLFLAAWYQAGNASLRTVGTDGTMGGLSSFGPGAGDIALRYNSATQTTLLGTKYLAAAALYAVELNDNLVPNPILIVNWDGAWPEYTTSIAADEINGRWLVTAAQTAGGRGALVQGAGGSGQPNPVSKPQMSLDLPGSGSILADSVTVAGWALDMGASAGTGIDAIHVWAFPTNGGQPFFCGATGTGVFRPDVGAAFGAQFNSSGFHMSGTLPIGNYDLVVYAHSSVSGTFNNSRTARIRIRPAVSTPHLAIDTPQPNAGVGTSVTVAGWALDLAAPSGNGVDAVHVWAWPVAGGTPIFLGAATPSVPRPDIANTFGSQFGSAGYQVAGILPAGTYDLAVYAHSTVAGAFNLARAVRVSVSAAASRPLMYVDTPAAGQAVGRSFNIGGWALDQGASSGGGVDAIHAWAYPTNGGAPIFAGAATPSFARSDIAAAFGATFLNSGFNVPAALPPGTYTLVVFARSTVAGRFNNAASVPITVQ